MITSTVATIALALLAAAIIIATGRAITHTLRDASRRIDQILDEHQAEEQLADRPGDDGQFVDWPTVRTHEGA